jgi:hypothetical protein
MRSHAALFHDAELHLTVHAAAVSRCLGRSGTRRVTAGVTLHPIVNQANPGQILPHFLNVHFNIILASTPKCSKWSSSLLVIQMRMIKQYIAIFAAVGQVTEVEHAAAAA